MNLHTDTTVITLFFSVPDVSTCDPSLALELDWLTYNDLCGSDHLPVVLKTSLRDHEPAAEHWTFDRAHWMSFLALCVSRLSDEQALSEDPVAHFKDTLIEIAYQTIPKYFEKAFDSVAWSFLQKVLDLFNFGRDIKSWIINILQGCNYNCFSKRSIF